MPDAVDAGFVDCSVSDAVATLTLSHPPLNTLTWAMRDALLVHFQQLCVDDDVRAVVLTGAGTRAFSAGTDIREFEATMLPGGGAERCRREHELHDLIDRFPKPVIAAINGWALGGGCELALACDFRVASRDARIGTPEVKIGCFPGGGGTERLPLLIGATRAKELMMLGDPINAEDAFHIGLVNRLAPPREALSVAADMALALASRPTVAVRMINELVDATLSHRSIMESALPRVMARVEDVFQSDDPREGAAAFLEKRSPRFTHRWPDRDNRDVT
jgi:enoyl-CoA hydratase/carnithine racemase